MLSILLHRSRCLLLCYDHTTLITETVRSGNMLPPILFFLLKTALSNQGLLGFHVNIRIFFYFCKEKGKGF